MDKAKEIIGAFLTMLIVLSAFGWIRSGSFSEIPFGFYLPASAIYALVKVYLFPILKGKTGEK